MKFMPRLRRGLRVQFAIAHLVDAVGVRGDVRVVGDQHDGVALVAQLLEQRQDLLAGPANRARRWARRRAGSAGG